MNTIVSSKPSLKGYLRTRSLIAHPVFVIIQLMIALWINFKGKAFKRAGVDFIFFELCLDTFASIMLLLCILIFRKAHDILIPYKKQHLILCISSGFVGVFLAQSTFSLGLVLSNASYTAPWMLLSPLFTTIIGIILKHEKPDRLKYLGLTISFLSTIGLMTLELINTKNSQKTYWANFMLFISSLSTASAVFFWKKLVLTVEIPVLIVAFWTLSSGSLFMLIFYIFKPFWYFWNSSPSLISSLAGLPTLISCFFIITLGYSFTYAIMIWATQKSVISTVALYPSARPIFTIFLSILISENSWEIDFSSIVLILFIFTGLLLAAFSKDVEWKNKKDSAREAKKTQLKSELSFQATEVQQTNSAKYYKLN